MKCYMRDIILRIIITLVFSLPFLPLLNDGFVVYAANMSVDEAITINEGTTSLTFRTNSGDNEWEQYKWYKFEPSETGWYLIELNNPIYLFSENNTYVCLYPSYSDVQNEENYIYKDLEESTEKISLISKLNANQQYYIKIRVSSDYDCDTDYNMTLSVGKTETPDAKVKFADKEVTYTLGDDNYESLELEKEGAENWTSSDEDVVSIDSGGWSSAILELKKPGSSVITAFDEDGLSDSCTVNVVTPEIVIPNKDITCNISEETASFEISNGYNLSFKSSDESVVKINDDSNQYRCYFDLVAPGSATIKVTDPSGRKEEVNVTITEAVWSLKKTVIDTYISDDWIELRINTETWNNHFTATSSNSKIVSVKGEDDNIYLIINNVGTTMITVQDSYGKTSTCTVNVRPDPLMLNKTSLKFYSYDDYNENDSVYPEGDYSEIASVKSSNTKVVTVKKVRREGVYVAEANPAGAGTATITITDQYGQKATVSVTVTQKYIDESKYLDDLCNSYVNEGSITYGDTTLYCACEIAASVYTIINGKKYTGSVNSDGYYVIRGIPKLSAGKKITITFQKGQARHDVTETIQKRSAGYLTATAKTQTYTGKALKPAVTVKYGKTVLKTGTDYNVYYSSNKKVGVGKATIIFKGNYKGAKAAYFIINPKPTILKKVSFAKKYLWATWKKQARQTTGYQIQYSTNKDFKFSNKTVTISKAKTISKKIKILKARKTIYVRIRTYMTVHGKKYYSRWSKAKVITIK